MIAAIHKFGDNIWRASEMLMKHARVYEILLVKETQAVRIHIIK